MLCTCFIQGPNTFNFIATAFVRSHSKSCLSLSFLEDLISGSDLVYTMTGRYLYVPTLYTSTAYTLFISCCPVFWQELIDPCFIWKLVSYGLLLISLQSSCHRVSIGTFRLNRHSIPTDMQCSSASPPAISPLTLWEISLHQSRLQALHSISTIQSKNDNESLQLPKPRLWRSPFDMENIWPHHADLGKSLQSILIAFEKVDMSYNIYSFIRKLYIYMLCRNSTCYWIGNFIYEFFCKRRFRGSKNSTMISVRTTASRAWLANGGPCPWDWRPSGRARFTSNSISWQLSINSRRWVTTIKARKVSGFFRHVTQHTHTHKVRQSLNTLNTK